MLYNDKDIVVFPQGLIKLLKSNQTRLATAYQVRRSTRRLKICHRNSRHCCLGTSCCRWHRLLYRIFHICAHSNTYQSSATQRRSIPSPPVRMLVHSPLARQISRSSRLEDRVGRLRRCSNRSFEREEKRLLSFLLSVDLTSSRKTTS